MRLCWRREFDLRGVRLDLVKLWVEQIGDPCYHVSMTDRTLVSDVLYFRKVGRMGKQDGVQRCALLRMDLISTSCEVFNVHRFCEKLGSHLKHLYVPSLAEIVKS